MDNAESVCHCNFHIPKTGEKSVNFLAPMDGLYSCKIICSLPFLNKLYIVVSRLAMHTVERDSPRQWGCVRHCVSLLWDAPSNLCNITQMKGNHKKGNATGNCEDWSKDNGLCEEKPKTRHCTL